MTRTLLTVAVAACAATPRQPIPMPVLIDGDRAAAGDLSPAAVDGLELHEVALPDPAPPATDDSSVAITHARAAFANGDLGACRDALGKIDVVHLLAAGERNLASRTLVLLAACSWPDKAGALGHASRLAGFGLELPDMTVPPEIDKLLGEAIRVAGTTPRHPLAISGVVGAQLAVDGRAADCTLPCTIDLAPGDHVLAVAADGYTPVAQLVRTPDVDHLTVAQEPATRELATRQWRARLGRGLPALDGAGIALLAKLGGSRITYLHADTQLMAALVVDGKLVASATRPRGDATGAVREVGYDGGILHRPSVFERPWFWIATAAAAVVIAGVIVAVTYKPEPQTALNF